MPSLLTNTVILLVSITATASAQTVKLPDSLVISGYLETYLAAHTDNDRERPPFFYSHHRTNEVNLNLAFIRAAYRDQRVRGNLALMAGTYTNQNLASEPGVLRNIMEASVGVNLSRQGDTWIEMGVFPSHIGMESAIGRDCWNLTRSIAADNTPYYEAGIRLLRHSANGKWLLSLLYLNGWQTIQPNSRSGLPGIGHQVQYTHSERVMLNSSSYISRTTRLADQPMRYFHNFYSQFRIRPKLSAALGFDIGMENERLDGRPRGIWISPLAMVRTHWQGRWQLGGRLEYYSDPGRIIIDISPEHPFEVAGWSVNLDYLVGSRLMWRNEVRGLHAPHDFFDVNDQPSSTYLLWSTAMAFSF